MKSLFKILLNAGLLWTAQSAPRKAETQLQSRATLLLPSADPFYRAPNNISDYAPGAIIRSRSPPTPLSFYSFQTNLANARQLLFRTNGVNGEPLASVTTVLIPHNAKFGKLLSYQVEIDAPWEGCFPSITLQQPGANVGSISSQYGELWFISALARGWVVAVPDHEGPDAAFGCGILSGQVTLDGLRAVLQSQSVTGVLPDARTVIWGYSGGSQATEFALELQPHYAPELEIIAAAMGGLPVNFANVVAKINKGVGAGLAPAAISGLAKAYPELQKLLDEKILSQKKAEFEKVQGQCAVPTVVQFAYQDFFSYIDGGDKILDAPPLSQALNASLMGQRYVSKVPTYLYHAVNDELLPMEDVDKLYDRYCDAGANIQLTREAFGEHIIVALTGAAKALAYLIDRMEGKPLELGCRKATVTTSSLEPEALPVLGQFVFNDVLAILELPVGPQAWIDNANK